MLFSVYHMQTVHSGVLATVLGLGTASTIAIESPI
jgi:hypothetical protein